MTKKIKIKYFTIADYLEEEKWLEKEHKNGWKLVKMIAPWFFIFEKSQFETAIYKLDFKNQRITEDYIQMYKDYGWEYLGSCLRWNYFRKLDGLAVKESDKEIFSDNESKLNMINDIYKTRMLHSLLIFFATIIPAGFFGFGRIFTITIIGVIDLILLIVYLFLFIYCGLKLAKLRKSFKK